MSTASEPVWVELEFGDETRKLPVERLREILLRAGWHLQAAPFTSRLVTDHGYRLIPPAQVAVLDAAVDLPEAVLSDIASLPERRAADFVSAVRALHKRGAR
jgi:hypothetical protein